MLSSTLPLLVLAARTVYAVGCAHHTFTQCADGITHWYDPDDGQICDPIDCGGGRAPPITTNPCCGNYKGTAACVTTPSYLPCFVKSTSSVSSTSTTIAVTTITDTSGQVITTSPTTTLSSPSSTTTTTAQGTGGDESGGSAASTTQPPAGKSTSQTTSSVSNVSNSSGPSTTSVPNAAGCIIPGSLIAVAGAAVGGVVALI